MLAKTFGSIVEMLGTWSWNVVGAHQSPVFTFSMSVVQFRIIDVCFATPFFHWQRCTNIVGDVDLLNDIPNFGMPYEVNKGSKDPKTSIKVEVNEKIEYFGAH